MKKFTRIIIYIATTMICLGAIILIITSMLGAPAKLISHASEGLYNINNKFVNTTLYPAINNAVNVATDSPSISFNDDYPIYTGLQKNLSFIDGSEIKDINISFGAGALAIKRASSDQLGFECDATDSSSYQFYVEEHILYINAFATTVNHGTDNQFTLYIPENCIPENIFLSVGVVDIDIDYLVSSNSIQFDLGAGSISCHKLDTKDLTVNLGAGDCDLNNSNVINATIDLAMGSVSFNGTVQNDLSVDCSMGDLDMTIQDAQENHNYALDCSMGNLTLGRNTYSGMSIVQYIDNDVDSTYTISCSMGETSIRFND